VESPGRAAPGSPSPRAAALSPPELAAAGSEETLFSNTYYDFPVEQGGAADTPLYTTRCELISVVPASFHDRLCVQGSGRMSSGETVSFGSRDCACAAVCPRTGQRICYEVLDAARFPSGR